VLRARAAELYESGEYASADACIGAALVKVTSDLELLAAQADALRRFRDARRASPATAPALPTGCIVDAAGSSICLPELVNAPADVMPTPTSIDECGSEQTALTLLQQHSATAALAPLPDDAADAATEDGPGGFYDGVVLRAAQRHWWSAAKRAVDELRKANVPPSSESRRAVTEIRDEAGSLLALMRQTKMDEATISCAVMWAQGERSIHLNVKFASRLDAPVTVLNVDNEVVSMNATHVSFSGIGRQKPKRYVVNLGLYMPIDPNASTWAFGSVGTVRFVLRKAAEGTWSRLLASNESVKNHRVWWEKQEQVEAEDRKARTEEARLKREEEEEERRLAREVEAAEAAKVAEQLRVERAAKRELQMPALTAALAAFDTFHDAPAESQADTMSGALAGAKEVLRITGQEANETAAADAEQMLKSMVDLRSTGFAELTADALREQVARYKAWLEEQLEPEPKAPPSPPAPKAAKKTKKKAKKKAAKAK
jgi:hypothetical protein